MGRLIKPLDRYVFGAFLRIFAVSCIGFPLLVIVFDLVEHLDEYLNQKLPMRDIAMSYVWWIPESVFFVIPAAVLFATVFTIGAATRHSEIAAAKASGISFYRFILPLFLGAVLAAGLDLGVGELVPRANRRRSELLQAEAYRPGNNRYNFTYVGEEGRLYKVNALAVDSSLISGVQIVRKGTGPEYPTYLLTAEHGRYDAQQGVWRLHNGTLNVFPDTSGDLAIAFDSVSDRHMNERPEDLTEREKAPQEMDYKELGRFISAMERSGANVAGLRVERMLKLAIPLTCVIILLFGAPLATSTERGGAAYGIGISLGTTVVFLMLNQLTKAIGGSELIRPPELAALIPSILFGVIGVIMLARVRT
jgi:lipopolysaccharide export system permease protein